MTKENEFTCGASRMLLGIGNTANSPSVTRAPCSHRDLVTVSSAVATQEVEVGLSHKPRGLR